MSRKQVVKARPGRKAEVERKRDERAARRALAKERRNRPEAEGGEAAEEFLSFANQLQALGLRLREVPGDGNCLFRALGDQLEGHSRNHLKHRQETVDYMVRQRTDFEPFVEDDIPFDRHIASLAKPGTFAGNDAIVAFARNNEVNVVIHQLNKPLWQIRGTDKANARELHIAYRYGEHYDSVRRFNDNSETPACLRTEMLGKDSLNKKTKNRPDEESSAPQETEDFQEQMEEVVQKVHNATGCSDVELILQNLEAENYNVESAVFAILQMNELKRIDVEEEATEPEVGGQHGSELWADNGSGTRIFGNRKLSLSGAEDDSTQNNPKEENKTNKNKPQKSTKQRKVEQRQEKKRRQEERHRQKVLETRSNNADNNRQSAQEPDPQVTLVKAFAAVTI
ncbi:OTU domain-containing protein 3 isoform X2 [Rhinatrema bivittatum]|uniref:OTU domain-containing protein 3 isoform X2 n=1 Tax=Rhinatrema bivittatum TaxID=194408 RepID=UPI00112DA7DD|nr:OTU domain-containing protein 3 isoform X2 [Rhinatrema bivittatum]